MLLRNFFVSGVCSFIMAAYGFFFFRSTTALERVGSLVSIAGAALAIFQFLRRPVRDIANCGGLVHPLLSRRIGTAARLSSRERSIVVATPCPPGAHSVQSRFCAGPPEVCAAGRIANGRFSDPCRNRGAHQSQVGSEIPAPARGAGPFAGAIEIRQPEMTVLPPGRETPYSWIDRRDLDGVGNDMWTPHHLSTLISLQTATSELKQ